MAKLSSLLYVDWFGLRITMVNMSDWTSGQDEQRTESNLLLSSSSCESDHQKRSDIVHAIIHNRSLDHLERILASGWDVNETLWMPNHYVHYDYGIDGQNNEVLVQDHSQRNALCEAAKQGWTDGLRMLLDAGADPNNHDNQFKKVPLLLAITNEGHVDHIKFLLINGADPNIIAERSSVQECPLSLALGCEAFTPLFTTLVSFGANVNYSINGQRPFLHAILAKSSSSGDCNVLSHCKEQLGIFFLQGGNIHVEDGYHRTALDFTLRKCSHPDITRWLIRHGADMPRMTFTQIIPCLDFRVSAFLQIPLILLHAGKRPPPGVLAQLQNMEPVMATLLEDEKQNKDDFLHILMPMWDKIAEIEESELQNIQGNVRKLNFPEYWTHQMSDLEEFSDESLHIYPDEERKTDLSDQDIFYLLNTLIEYLSQPRSLQWHCRRCVRDNLVSLQPSVVKTLPGPARLKRFILCHEI